VQVRLSAQCPGSRLHWWPCFYHKDDDGRRHSRRRQLTRLSCARGRIAIRCCNTFGWAGNGKYGTDCASCTGGGKTQFVILVRSACASRARYGCQCGVSRSRSHNFWICTPSPGHHYRWDHENLPDVRRKCHVILSRGRRRKNLLKIIWRANCTSKLQPRRVPIYIYIYVIVLFSTAYSYY